MISLIALLGTIFFVPLDDRPVTAQLPPMLGAIAGVAVDETPPALLGRYLRAGDADAIGRWLGTQHLSAGDSVVASTDMLAYGGLVASRVPGVSYADAATRLSVLARVRRAQPRAWIAAFGTVMRLAPTGVPAGTEFFAAYPVWRAIQQYANLHDPPAPDEILTAAQLREQIGQATLDAYLATRARNLAVDDLLVAMTQAGTIDRLALGQDDAGPVGLHVRDVAALRAFVVQRQIGDRVAVEPGADELGMILVAHALALRAGWSPHVAVRYSMPDGATVQDPLEFAPIEASIDGLIALGGGVRDDLHPDLVLAVRVPHTDAAHDDAFLSGIDWGFDARVPVALADLSFLESYASQSAFAKRLLDSGDAQRLDAYASWNTNANTVGTALAEAIAAGAGRRLGTYDATAHRTFTFMRLLDDYIFHDEVRPQLNAALDAQGIDHTLLAPAVAAQISALNRRLLWDRAFALAHAFDPTGHLAALAIALPWDRTFEVRIDASLAPNL